MAHKRCWLAVVVLLYCCWSSRADDPPKPDAAPKLYSLGELAGVLHMNAGSEAKWSLHVTYSILEANPQAQGDLLREQQDILRRQQQIMTTRNPIQRRQQLVGLLQEVARMQQTEQNLFRLKQVSKDLEVQPADDIKVRMLQPPVEYDDKGFPKKYTKDELKELKGDPKLPGYNADMSNLQSGQVVVLYLAAKKGDKDPNARPLVTMAVIVSEEKGK